MRIKTKEFEIVEIEGEEGVDLGSGIKESLLYNVVLQGGNSFIVPCCVSGQHHLYILHGHWQMKPKFNANIGFVIPLKLSHVR